MNVWIVNHYAWPPSGSGGTRHHGLAVNLIKRGHDVLVFAGNLNHFNQDVRPVEPQKGYRIQLEDGVPFCWLRVPPYRGNSIGRIWNMVCFARRMVHVGRKAPVEKPDVIIGSSVHPFAAWAAQRCADHFNVPFVFEVRDLWPQTLIDLGSFKRWHPFILLLGRIEMILYRKAAEVITLLPLAGEFIAAKGVPRERISWIPNGVDLGMIPRTEPPDERNPFIIAYAGGIGLANGLDSILEVARRLKRDGWEKRVLFRIYGNGPDRPRLEAESARDGLRNVEFNDWLPKVRVYEELSKAHAFYLYILDSPLYRWGYSMNKLFDYLAGARPVLLVTGSEYDPVSDAGAGLRVDPRDQSGIVQAVKELAEMPTSRLAEMGRNGRRFAEKHHDFKNLSLKLEAVLEKSLGMASNQAPRK